MKTTLSILALALCLAFSFGAAASAAPEDGPTAAIVFAVDSGATAPAVTAEAIPNGDCDALAQSLGAQAEDPTLASYNPNCPPRRCNTDADCGFFGPHCGLPAYCGGYCHTYDAPLCSYKKGCICYLCP